MSYELKITSHFWKKDTNSLYDYDTNELTTSMIKIKNKCQLFQNGKYLKAVQDLNSIDEKSPYYIGNILIDSGNKNSFKFKIQDELYVRPSESNPKIISDNWLILRHTYSTNDVGFHLREGIMIKLGKVVFKVREVSVGDERTELEKLELNYNETKLHIERNPTNNEILSNNENFEVYDENYEHEDPEEEIENNLNMSSNNNIANLTNDAISYSKNLTNVPINTYHHDMTNPYNQINLNSSNNISSTTVINIKRQISGMKFPLNKLQSIYNKDKPNKKQSNCNNICRICLGDSCEDILVSVCKCLGSVKFIHLNCLRRWLISKINLKTFNHLTVYSYKNLECELCKSTLTDTIKIKNKTINLINLHSIIDSGNLKGIKKISNYIALECIKERPSNSPTDYIEKKTVYIINMKEKISLKIGRSTESDVRMTDISVSRHHAVLNIENGQMFLKDINSKFGTHVNVDLNQEIIVLPKKKLAIQCGRFYLLFEIVKTCMGYLSCLIKKENLKLWQDYNDYFNCLDKLKAKECEVNKFIVEKEKKINILKSGQTAIQSVKILIREKDQINDNDTNLNFNANLQNLNTANNQLIINTNFSVNNQAITSIPNAPIDSRLPLINPLIIKEEINQITDRDELILMKKQEVMNNYSPSIEKESFSNIEQESSNFKEITHTNLNKMKKLNLKTLNLNKTANRTSNIINSKDLDKEFYDININSQPHPHGRNTRNGTVFNFSSRLNQYNSLQCKKIINGQETEDLTAANKYTSHRGISNQMTNTETENYFVEDTSIPGMKIPRLIKNNKGLINKIKLQHEINPEDQREVLSPSFSPRP